MATGHPRRRRACDRSPATARQRHDWGVAKYKSESGAWQQGTCCEETHAVAGTHGAVPQRNGRER